MTTFPSYLNPPLSSYLPYLGSYSALPFVAPFAHRAALASDAPLLFQALRMSPTMWSTPLLFLTSAKMVGPPSLFCGELAGDMWLFRW